MAEQVVETYNLFLDSDDAKSDGQDYNFQLGNNTIETRGPTQYIRFTLQNFNMLKTWSNVNFRNNSFVIRYNATGSPNGTSDGVPTSLYDPAQDANRGMPVSIPTADYADLNSLIGTPGGTGANFGLAAAFITALNNIEKINQGITTDVWEYDSTINPTESGINITSDRKLSFKLKMKSTATYTSFRQSDVTAGLLTPQVIFDYGKLDQVSALSGGTLGIADGGETGILLGCDRLFSTDSGVNQVGTATNYRPSFTLIITGGGGTGAAGTTIQVNMPYQANRFTQPNVYVRMTPAAQVFASPTVEEPIGLSSESNVNPSNVLAEIPIDTEIVQYQPNKAREYFLNFYQKQISHFSIRITDSHGLPLLIDAGASQGFNSTNRGNRSFTMTVRVDIVGGVAHHENAQARAPSIPKKFPARFDSNVLMWQKNAQETLTKPAGYS